jgi:uncharacterized protein (DUF427 family)
MLKAIWKGAVIAQSDDTTLLEGDHYFPPETVNRKYLKDSDQTSASSWMGEARFFHVVVGKDVNENAAFYYPEPSKAAAAIRNHVAFIKDVRIVSQEGRASRSSAKPRANPAKNPGKSRTRKS